MTILMPFIIFFITIILYLCLRFIATKANIYPFNENRSPIEHYDLNNLTDTQRREVIDYLKKDTENLKYGYDVYTKQSKFYNLMAWLFILILLPIAILTFIDMLNLFSDILATGDYDIETVENIIMNRTPFLAPTMFGYIVFKTLHSKANFNKLSILLYDRLKRF